MSLSLVLLGLFLALLALQFFPRGGSNRTRPAFRQADIYAGRLTEGLLHALLSDRGFLRDDTRVSGVHGSSVILDREGACGRLVLFPVLGFGGENDLPALKALAARHRADRSPTLVVVGGAAPFAREAFAATAPLRALHIDDGGQVRETRRGFGSPAPRLVVENALDRMEGDLREGAFPAIGFETVRGLVTAEPEAGPGRNAGFRGVVTSALTLALLLCFVVEVAISRDSIRGVGAAVSVIFRMGAIHEPAVLQGEWQRLIAAPFLHFGVLHLLMNGWAQWSLGTPIEFLVGSWRFLALWTFSAIGASLTSLFVNGDSISAGASGAIFGLLGAFTTFVFFRKDILPQPVPRGLRNGVIATLLLNAMISFIPGIDTAAHAGGFITGAFMAYGLVGRARPRSGPANPRPLRLAVALLVLLGVGLTSLTQRADLTMVVPRIAGERRVGEVSLPTLEGFEVAEWRRRGLVTVELDGAPASPFSVTYKVGEQQADEESAIRVLKTLRSREAPPGASDWIALSRLGVQGNRPIEIVVVAPASSSDKAEVLGAALAEGIR